MVCAKQKSVYLFIVLVVERCKVTTLSLKKHMDHRPAGITKPVLTLFKQSYPDRNEIPMMIQR